MRVQVISAHPDDETLGCGGILLKHHAAGDNLYWTIVSSAFEPNWSGEAIEAKSTEVRKVAEAYPFEECYRLGFQATRLDTHSHAEIIESIRESVSQAKPELVYVVYGGDVHTDHQTAFTASMSVLKPLEMTKMGVRKVLCYETLSSTEAAPPLLDRAFLPNVISDITPYMRRKLEIMEIYDTEVQPDPMPRGTSALKALARYRGSSMGVEYAEAFMLMRELT